MRVQEIVIVEKTNEQKVRYMLLDLNDQPIISVIQYLKYLDVI